MSRRAIFLDRDGTIVQERGYLSDPKLVELTSHAAEALELMMSKEYVLVLATNQSGVARGFYKESDVRAVNQRMQELLGNAVRFERLYVCPHLPEGLVPQYSIACDCRKPAPGMLKRAERELGVDLSKSLVVGDSLRDVQAGRAAGTRTVLVLTGLGAEYVKAFGAPSEADYIAQDLLDAARWITP